MKPLLTLLACLYVLAGYGQTPIRSFDDENRPFFEAQLPNFQAWLEDKGFTQVLSIDYMELRPDMLTLYLYLSAYDRDSAASVWKGFVEQYQRENISDPAKDLHTYLSFLMHQPRDRITIELYDIDRNDHRTPCFYLGMFYEKGRFDTETSGCMSEKRQVRVPYFSIQKDSCQSELIFKDPKVIRQNRTLLMDSMIHFTETYFKERGSSPTLTREGPTQARIEVLALEREVLKDAPQGLLEMMFGLAQKERLLLIFDLEEEDEEFVLKMEIHGMYGSGIFTISDSGYRPMEPYYKSYLGRFASRFQTALYAHLNKK